MSSSIYSFGESRLTCEQILKIARFKQKVSLSSEAAKRIKASRCFLEQKCSSGETIYGVNTGIGNLSEVMIDDDQLDLLQRNMVYSHSAGIGEPMPLEFVRAAMASRVNVMSQGHSAVRLEIAEFLIELLNKDVVPVVCSKGSVGACGDLAPMSQIALLTLGEGEAWFQGERGEGGDILKKAGITPPGLKVRDGLAMINGSNFITGISALQICEFKNLLKQAEIACAMSVEALLGNVMPFCEPIHVVRGFKGSVRSAAMITRCMEEGDLKTGRINPRLQDAYSLRTTPQVIGSARDALDYSKSQVEIELNGVGDNPIFFHEEGVIQTGANFQASPISLPMDMMSAAITSVCVLSERRLNRLQNEALNNGLPPFLAEAPGLNSGMMVSQYTVDTLIVEQRMLCAPASVASIPAAADQEDFTSMGMNTAHKNQQILENARAVIGIEMMTAAQALDMRKNSYGVGTAEALRAIREKVAFLKADRPLYKDHNTMAELVKSGEILRRVEEKLNEAE